MGSRRGDEGFEEGRPVEPEEARAHDNDPDAVTIHRRGAASGERDAQGQVSVGRREDAGREGTSRRVGGEEDEPRRSDSEGGQSEGMARGDKVLISALAALGAVLLVVILVLSLLRSPEWIQLVLALILFAALGLGAYRYVITPSGRRQESGSD